MSSRVLVMGATGYVGSRLVPRLAEEVDRVRALVRDPDRAERFGWGDSVEVVAGDVLDQESVDAALEGVDTVVYLVHGMGGDDFAETDRRAAHQVGTAAAAVGVRRVVYLSGLVPDVAESELSEHLASRLEVERILQDHVPTVSLRAAVVLGSGSTSFEVIRQLAERLPLHTVPDWMDSQVQPVAVTDVVDAIVAAVHGAGDERAYDLGGPDRMSYPDLLRTYCAVAGLERAQLPLPAVPTGLVAELAARFSDLPTSTVRSLVESLRHDMVCRDDDAVRDLLDGREPLGLEPAVHRALDEPDDAVPDSERDLLGPMSFDPDWASGGTERGSWVGPLADARERAALAARSVIDSLRSGPVVEPERTPDGRYVVVDGRRWRATDPGVPDALRAELVAELMEARRLVRSDPASARPRVHDAKVALGERGLPWWETPDRPALEARLGATMRALLRHRDGGTICPSDAARVVGGTGWRDVMEVAREVARDLAADGELVVTQRGEEVDLAEARGPVRLAPGPALLDGGPTGG